MVAVSFGEALWLVIISFLFITYLMMLFSVVIDLFRDRELSGVWKAVWAVALIVFPLITMLAYLIVRGGGMAERSMRVQQQSQAALDDYVRGVAGSSPTAELARAAELRAQGTLSEDEYLALKAKILA